MMMRIEEDEYWQERKRQELTGNYSHGRKCPACSDARELWVSGRINKDSNFRTKAVLPNPPTDTIPAEFTIMDSDEWHAYLQSPQAKFEERAFDISDELVYLLCRKQEDYGSANIAAAPGGAMNGLLVRMHDKLARIVNLTKDDKNPNYESLKDSFMDLANYSIIAIMVLNGWWEGASYDKTEGDCE